MRLKGGILQGRGKSGLTDAQLADFQTAVEILEADGGVKVQRLLFTPSSTSD